jgi:hypothetical protein
MSLRTTDVLFDELSADPGTTVDGQTWYNTTADRFKGQRGGVVKTFTDKEELDAHTGSTSNPHSTTLEQARTAGNTLAGDINMNNAGKITNLTSPVSDGDAANKGWTNSQIQSYIKGLDWQESVLDRWNPTGGLPPGPSVGHRYISTATANGWTINYIYQWTGSVWDPTVPNEGFCCRVEDENVVYLFDGSTWGQFAATLDHGALQGLGDDDHTQYLLVNGTRMMAGGLNMGTYAISNVGTVDGVTVSAHASRHNPGGADAVTTAAPSSVGTSNTEGNATSLARSNHIHDHGTQSTGAHHAVASSSGAGFQGKSNAAAADPTVNDDTAAGYVRYSRWVNTSTQHEWVCLDATTGAAVWKNTTLTGASGYLVHKAGRVLNASFSGTPRKATVTFGTAFADANYAVTCTPVTGVSGAGYTIRIESQTAAGFTINMGTSSITGMIQVNWAAIKDGEST